MASYKIGLSADQSIVHIALAAQALPLGYTNLGDFDHGDADEDDLISSVDSTHVLFHDVQEILGQTSKADPTESAIFPDNITDMAGISIIKGWEAAPEVTTAPTITGTAQVGAVLTSVLGTWSGPAPTVTRQWKANGVVIAAATNATYTVLIGDLAKVITCEVKAVNAFGEKIVVSGPTAAVIAA